MQLACFLRKISKKEKLLLSNIVRFCIQLSSHRLVPLNYDYKTPCKIQNQDNLEIFVCSCIYWMLLLHVIQECILFC